MIVGVRWERESDESGQVVTLNEVQGVAVNGTVQSSASRR